MKKINVLLLAALSLTCACAILGNKSSVDVYYRADVPTHPGKVIVFPVLGFDGRKTEGTRNMELSLLGKWADTYGKGNIIPVGPALEQLAGSGGFAQLVKSLDASSSVEQLHQDPRIREAIGSVTSALGGAYLGMAVLSGGQQGFDAGQEVRLHIGLFDVQNMTWKWITKAVAKKGKVGRWELTSADLINSSFKEITVQIEK